MKFLLEIDGEMEFTDEVIPEDCFVVAYESSKKVYLIVDIDSEEKLIELIKNTNASAVHPIRVVKKLGKVVYKNGYKEVIDP